MPAVYSKFLCGLDDPTAGATVLGTPPAGHKWILKDISVFNDTPSGGGLFGFWIYDGSGHKIFAQQQPWVAASGFYEWHGSQVIEEFDSVWWFSNDFVAWSSRICGYELVLP